MTVFSPLADEAPPDMGADICWLPGGYPELHAGKLAAAETFRAGLQKFAETRPVHGECGGYMAMGEGLVDKEGNRHQMAGLLGLETSYEKRKMHLATAWPSCNRPPCPVRWKARACVDMSSTIRPSWPSPMRPPWPACWTPMATRCPRPVRGVAMPPAPSST